MTLARVRWRLRRVTASSSCSANTSRVQAASNKALEIYAFESTSLEGCELDTYFNGKRGRPGAPRASRRARSWRRAGVVLVSVGRRSTSGVRPLDELDLQRRRCAHAQLRWRRARCFWPDRCRSWRFLGHGRHGGSPRCVDRCLRPSRAFTTARSRSTWPNGSRSTSIHFLISASAIARCRDG